MKKNIIWGTAVIILSFAACGKIKTDPEVVSLLEKIEKECGVTIRYAMLKKCDKQKREFAKLRQAKGTAGVLPTLASHFNSDNENKSAIAISFIYNVRSYFSKIVKNPKLVKTKVTMAFINGLKKMQKYQAYYVAQLATDLAMLHGKEAEIFEVADSHSEDVVRNSIYRSAMRYGRLKVFERIKKAAQSSKKYLASNAIAATQKMFKMNSDEKNKVCEWLKTQLNRSSKRESAEAAKALVTRCKGEYIDTVLDLIEKIPATELKKSPFRLALTSYTFSCKKYFMSKPTGSPQQCKRKEALKKKLK